MPRLYTLGRLAVLTAVWLTPALGAPAALAAPSAPQQQAGASHRAVFELASAQPEGWAALLKNLENLISHYGAANASFEVVAHGMGIGLMLRGDAELAARMEALAKQGVVFAACANTMKAKGIAKERLLPFVAIVPAGVAELIEKQEAGWAYIRSGH